MLVVRILVLAFACVGLGLGVAGLVTAAWEVQKFGGRTTEIGLFQSCDGGSCKDINFADISNPATGCTKKGDDAKLRFQAVQALVIIGASFGFGAMVTAASGSKVVSVVRVIFTIVESSGFGAAAAVFLHTMNYFYFCDKDFCSFQTELGNTGACESQKGYSYYLILAAAGLSFISIVFAIVAFIKRDEQVEAKKRAIGAPPGMTEHTEAVFDDNGASTEYPGWRWDDATQQWVEDPATSEHPGWKWDEASQQWVEDPSTKVNTEPTSEYPGWKWDEVQQQWVEDPSTKVDTEHAANDDLPEGDWVLDENSGWYWSQTQQLFYNRETKQFFDQNSGQWFNPETQEWYTPS